MSYRENTPATHVRILKAPLLDILEAYRYALLAVLSCSSKIPKNFPKLMELLEARIFEIKSGVYDD